MLKRSVRLPAFLSQAAKGKRLKPAERRRLVAQALLLFEGFYVHLPQKRAMYAVDPVQRLKLLLSRLQQFADDIALYRELIDIFTSVRDFHTRFELPPPFDSAVAYLPFWAGAAMLAQITSKPMQAAVRTALQQNHLKVCRR